MNAVIGMSNLLLDTSLDERQRDFAETIRSGAEALLTVLNDILDFSKIEAGRLQVESVEFDLREVIENAVGLLAPRAADKGLEMALLLPPDLPCAVRGDPGRLRQVILNLLGNAVKFTEQGEVLLSVGLAPEGESTLYRFEFQDTGVGLTEEQQARLFRPFSQADTSTTRRFGGTGLGLAISKQIVELMGGACGVRSRLGHGSTFWFTARLPAGSGRTTTPPLEVPPLPPARILVIDDSEVSRRVFQTYLTHCGLQCETEMSPLAALERIQQALTRGNPYAAVVVDDTLPGTSSLETIRAIRSNPALASMRVLACTSPNRVFHPAEMEKLSVDDVVGKPLRYADLLGAFRKLFSNAPRESREPFTGGKGLSAPPLPPGPQPAEGGPEGLRVLVAEDNLVNQRVVMLQLQKLGHRATAVNNGLEAIQALERDRFDVILMDCQMPVMDGIEATRVIRSRPDYAGTRIIALTADVMHGARERCADAGMDDYLSKPIRVGELQTALAKFVRKT
jgi:CheY-like chemotaxis protein